MAKLKGTNLEVLQVIAKHGGTDVGTLLINTQLGGGLYTPLYFALKDLTKFGYVQEVCTGLNSDGSPRRGWSLTPTGITALNPPTRRQALVQNLRTWFRYKHRRIKATIRTSVGAAKATTRGPLP